MMVVAVVSTMDWFRDSDQHGREFLTNTREPWRFVQHLNLHSHLYSNVCCGLCILVTAVSNAKVWYSKLGESSSQPVLTYNGKHVYADTCIYL